MLSREENELLTQTSAGTLMGSLMRRAWQPVALSEELPLDGAPLPVHILGEDLVLFRDDRGKLGLLGRRCPHRGSDLNYGRIEDGGLRCLYHGWLFDTSGNCLEQPAEPAGSEFCKKIHHTAYPCQEIGGLIFAYLGPGAPPVLPRYEALLAPDDHKIIRKYFVDCNYLQSIENHVDPSHVAFLHRNLGDGEDVDVYDRKTGATRGRVNNPATILSATRHLAPRFELEMADFGFRVFTIHDLGEKTYFRCNTFITPNLAAITGVTAGDGYTMFWNVPTDDSGHFKYGIEFRRSCPIDKETFRRQAVAEIGPDYRLRRNRANRHLQDRQEMKTSTFSGFSSAIFVQDLANTEGQGVIQDRTQERLGYSDKPVIALRQTLLKGARQMQNPEHRASANGSPPQPVVLSEIVPTNVDLISHIRRRVTEEDRFLTERMLAS